MKKYTHESEELNALLNKKVRIRLFDNTVYVGILERDKDHKGKYYLSGSTPISFRKTHVKKIKTVIW